MFQEKAVSETEYYKVGDLIDAALDGSWWEAKIIKITQSDEPAKPFLEHELTDSFSYHVEFERYYFTLDGHLIR